MNSISLKKSIVRPLRRVNHRAKQSKIICNALSNNNSIVPTDPVQKYLQYAETVNGRCAMQGFIWGSLREAFSHNTIMEQLMMKSNDGTMHLQYDGFALFIGVISLVTLGTTYTFGTNKKWTIFSDEAEKTNARLAMFGFIILTALHFNF